MIDDFLASRRVVAEQVAMAVSHHIELVRRNGAGRALVEELAEVRNLLTLTARAQASGGQERPTAAKRVPAGEKAHAGPRPLAYSYAAAGEALGVSARTVRRLVADGRLVAVPVGRARLIPHAELVRFLEVPDRCQTPPSRLPCTPPWPN